MSDQKPELLPCPFCGCRARIFRDENGYTPPSTWIVECASSIETMCGALMGGYSDEADAIAAWNRRPDTPAAVAGAEWYEHIPETARFTLTLDGKLVQDKDGPWVIRSDVDKAFAKLCASAVEFAKRSTAAPHTTPTPRTDAVWFVDGEQGCIDEYVDVDFARQLERELTAANAEIEALVDVLDGLLYAHDAARPAVHDRAIALWEKYRGK